MLRARAFLYICTSISAAAQVTLAPPILSGPSFNQGVNTPSPLPPAPTQPQPAPSPPANWYGAGGSYNSSTIPGTSSVSGWAGYAHLLVHSAGLWEFTQISAYSVKVPGQRSQLVNSTATGLLLSIRTFGPISLFAFGQVGVANSGNSAGNAFPYGGLVDIRLGSTLWHVDAGYQKIPSSLSGVDTQNIVLFGVGRLF